MKRGLGMILLIGAILLAACSGQVTATDSVETEAANEVSVEGGTYTLISPDELKAMLDEEDVTVINVYVPYQGYIAGTDVYIPYNEIDQSLDRLPQDKGARIVVYCRSGKMSSAASRTLLQLGYTNIYNLKGGYTAWQAVGYPMAGEE
ncbi:MAG: rhodanese-like domain-containing protein [Anaerolineales bacterium]